MKNQISIIIVSLLLASCFNPNKPNTSENETGERWSIEKAIEWSAKQKWIRGCNFQPSTAINQLEMFQAETFDPETIDRELGWAEDLGLNAMRVYLHHAAWGADPEGFKKRLDQFLAIAHSHSIKIIFVFFDDCWNAEYAVGKQPEPKTGTHNSGWVQDPGAAIHKDPAIIVALEAYFKDVMSHFKNDERILLWDLYNEPGNSGYGNASMHLLQKAFEWGRAVNPVQPLSVGVWNLSLSDLNKFQVENSDIITYHNYSSMEYHQAAIDTLSAYGRPLICTEYMARKFGSTFQDVMPELQKQNIGAINWGFVSGKTNTIYAWDTPIPDGSEPETWFHDILRKDGSPYRAEEVALIRSLTNK
ncbi:MAG: cellulase family glycosylhydrolase [Prolixibacteraceae bacterium]|nr:cellulase family glycosylhydrolase [Prolixibacteraceae bacterium]